MNNSLSIVIPTYNRVDILKENIEIMFPKIKEFNLGIYISDDSNNDDTEKMIKSLSLQFDYPYFFYERNMPPLGHDENCISILQKAKSKFVWYLGDSIIIPLNVFDEVISIISKNGDDVDFICLNLLNRYNYQTGVVSDVHDFIVDSTWHMTLTGATIYNHKVVEWINNVNFHGRHKNFMQLGVILQYCEQFKAKFYWCGNLTILGNKNKKSYWTNNTVSVFAHDWWCFVDQFDKLFSLSEKKKIAKSHSLNTHVFGLKNFLQMRSNGELNLNLIRKYKYYLVKTSKTPFVLIFLITFIPIKLIQAIARKVKK